MQFGDGSYLLLNGDKSEAIVIGTAAQLKSVAAMKDVTVAGTSLPLSHELVTWRHIGHICVSTATSEPSHARPAPRTAHAVHRARRNDWVQHRRVAS